MARPSHETVEYFSHDSDASEGRTLTIIQGEFGLIGYAMWWKLLEWLGKSEGHYFDARNPDDLEFLLRKFGCDVVIGTGILKKLAKLGAIDPVLWEHRVIWSQNFVDRLEGLYKKREKPLPEKPCFCNEKCDHSLLLTGITGTETGVLGSGIDQSKVNKSKLKKTKEEESKENESSSSSDKGLDVPIYSIYRENIGELTPIVEKELNEALILFPPEQIAEAIALAVKAEKRNWGYASGILKNWQKEGHTPKDKRTAIVPASARTWTGETPQPDSNAQAHWNKALAQLEKDTSPANFRTWLSKTVGIARSGSDFIVQVPNAFVAEHLEKNQISLIEKALMGAIGEQLTVKFFCGTSMQKLDNLKKEGA